MDETPNDGGDIDKDIFLCAAVFMEWTKTVKGCRSYIKFLYD